jgi:hypothetical protein
VWRNARWGHSPPYVAVAQGCFSEPALQAMVADCMSFLSGIDFQFFMPIRLDPARLEQKLAPIEEDLIAVLRDYSRMLVLYRQRIVMEDTEAYEAKLDYEQFGTIEFFNVVRQKHKREFVWKMHNVMLNKLSSLADCLDYKKLKAKVKVIQNALPKEIIPMPKPVPNYILGRHDWIKAPTVDMSNDNLVRLILR